MDYGNPKVAGTASGIFALSLVGQIGLLLGALLVLILIALLIRYLWRKHKDIDER